MTRKEFIKMCGILGVGLPMQISLSSCETDDFMEDSANMALKLDPWNNVDSFVT